MKIKAYNIRIKLNEGINKLSKKNNDDFNYVLNRPGVYINSKNQFFFESILTEFCI